MNNQTELERARKEVERCRRIYLTTKSRRTRRDAEESLNWWQGKAAMLESKIAKGL